MKGKVGRNKRRTAAMLQSRNEVTKKKHITEKAFEESVKDNLADRVIENFVAGLAELPFENRFAFCLTLLRGNDEDPAQAVEDLAEKLNEALGVSGPWDKLDDGRRAARKVQAAGLFELAAIMK